MNPLQKALDEGYELLWCAEDVGAKTSIFMKNGKLHCSFVSEAYSEEREADSFWFEFVESQNKLLTIGTIKFPKVRTIAEAMSNHAKCIRCKDEIFMAGADKKDFVCYRCRN